MRPSVDTNPFWVLQLTTTLLQNADDEARNHFAYLPGGKFHELTAVVYVRQDLEWLETLGDGRKNWGAQPQHTDKSRNAVIEQQENRPVAEDWRQKCRMRRSVDLRGGELDYARLVVSSVGECCQSCEDSDQWLEQETAAHDGLVVTSSAGLKRCTAWTFVRESVEHGAHRCFLKGWRGSSAREAVPMAAQFDSAAVNDSCCVSGLRPL